MRVSGINAERAWRTSTIESQFCGLAACLHPTTGSYVEDTAAHTKSQLVVNSSLILCLIRVTGCHRYFHTGQKHRAHSKFRMVVDSFNVPSAWQDHMCYIIAVPRVLLDVSKSRISKWTIGYSVHVHRTQAQDTVLQPQPSAVQLASSKVGWTSTSSYSHFTTQKRRGVAEPVSKTLHGPAVSVASDLLHSPACTPHSRR